MWKSALAVYVALHAVGYGIAQQQALDDFVPSTPSTQGFNVPPSDTHNLAFKKLLDCEGYLTANPSQNFCSPDVPPNWQSREFNGMQFYLVPLEGRTVK